MRRTAIAAFAGSAGLLIAVMAWLYGIIGPPVAPAGQLIVPARVNAHAADAGPAQIVVLGTSLSLRSGWASVLQEKLRACSGRPITVRILAKAGASSSWGLRQFRQELGAGSLDTAGVLVIEFSGNDASLYNGMPLFMSRKNHAALIAEAQAKGLEVYLTTMSPAWGANAWERPGQRRYRELYRELAASTGSGLIDSAETWLRLSEAERKDMVPDGLHPADAAVERVFVPMIFAALESGRCAMNNTPENVPGVSK